MVWILIITTRKREFLNFVLNLMEILMMRKLNQIEKIENLENASKKLKQELKVELNNQIMECLHTFLKNL